MKKLIITFLLTSIASFVILKGAAELPKLDIVLANNFNFFKWWAALTAIIFLKLLAEGVGKSQPEHHTTAGKSVKKTDECFYFDTSQGEVVLEQPYRGVLVLGGAGAGKTKSIIEPIIYQSVRNGYSGIMYDFKTPSDTDRRRMEMSNDKSRTLGEIANHAHLKYNPNVKQYFINFVDLNRSHRCNPLDPKYITKPIHAKQLAIAILRNTVKGSTKSDDSFFLPIGIGYFSGIIWYLAKEAPNFCTLPHAVGIAVYCDIKDVLGVITKNIEVENLVSAVKDAMGSEKTIANILASLKNGLSNINTSEIAWVLSGKDFNLDINDPKDPKFLTIGNNANVQDALSPVIALVISSALGLMNEPAKQKSVVILDEAPTLYLPNFDNTPATGRANKIATVYAAQDLSQMYSMYEKNEAEKIIANLGCQFYGQTNNNSTVQNIIELFGKVDYAKQSQSSGSSSSDNLFKANSSSNRSINTTIERKEILKASEITNLNRGEFLGQLVDSNFSTIKAKIKLKDYGAPPILEEFYNVSEVKIRNNFERIRQECKELISPAIVSGASPSVEQEPKKASNLNDDF